MVRKQTHETKQTKTRSFLMLDHVHRIAFLLIQSIQHTNTHYHPSILGPPSPLPPPHSSIRTPVSHKIDGLSFNQIFLFVSLFFFFLRGGEGGGSVHKNNQVASLSFPSHPLPKSKKLWIVLTYACLDTYCSLCVLHLIISAEGHAMFTFSHHVFILLILEARWL